MPKKAKGKKAGKDKKNGAKKELPPPSAPTEEPIDELSRQFYLIQIHDLEERLGRYQTKCDQLQVANDDLEKDLRQQLDDKEHIILLLKKKNTELTEHYMDLEEAMGNLKHEKEQERDKLMREITTIREDTQDRLDQLIAENMVLQGTLGSLEEFKAKKERLEADLKQKEDIIEQQKKDFDDQLYRLEKQAVLDKDRMRKEMVAKVNSVAAEFRKVSDLQMADTTKRTIQENVAINHQLSRMSDKTMDLVKENEQLKSREKELSRRIKILESSAEEVTRKNLNSQKVLGMLKDKLGEQEAVIGTLLPFKEQHVITQQKLLESEFAVRQSEQQVESLMQKLSLVTSQLEALKQEHADVCKELKRMQSLMSRSSQSIHQSMLSSQRGEAVQLTQQEGLLGTLLEVLSQEKSSSQQSIISKMYAPGDLGLIQQPQTGKMPTSLGRKELPPLRTPITASR